MEGLAMRMTIEPVSAFSSLDVLVAMDEGLFSAEGLDLRMASRESRDIRSTTEGTLSTPVTNQGLLQERGDATMFQGTWVAVPDLDPALYAAFLRGVIQAVRHIKADKRRYLSYFKEGWAAGDPAVQALTPDDFNLGRIQLREPTPIPEDEARWAWDWMASWGVLHGTFDATSQINRKVEREAHELAFAAQSG